MSVDRTAELLQRVADFLRKLPADQVDALASGEARLEVVPRGAKVTGPAAAAAGKATLDLDVGRIEADLRAIGTRAGATQYLKDLKLAKAALSELAKQLGVAASAKDSADKILSRIVEQKVGFRADHNAIVGAR